MAVNVLRHISVYNNTFISATNERKRGVYSYYKITQSSRRSLGKFRLCFLGFLVVYHECVQCFNLKFFLKKKSPVPNNIKRNLITMRNCFFSPCILQLSQPMRRPFIYRQTRNIKLVQVTGRVQLAGRDSLCLYSELHTFSNINVANF